ncbi:MAG: hypothetical protein EAZ12_08380 [Sphingobacteriia bacterium]|nr:MAG: hypothetical protein EAZ12_08380 [Sphingobacteriia bacterium]
MELDELKILLNQKLETDHLLRSEKDLADLLSQKAQSIYAKIKRSLWFEIISSFIIVIAFGYIGFTSKYQSINIYFSFFTALFIPFILIFFYLLNKTNKINQSNKPIKENMQNLVDLMEEFMKRYFQFTMALIPICFTFSFALGYNEKDPIPAIDHAFEDYNITKGFLIGFTIGYLVALTVGVFYFTKWYLKKLYGNYVQELKKYIAELQEQA